MIKLVFIVLLHLVLLALHVSFLVVFSLSKMLSCINVGFFGVSRLLLLDFSWGKIPVLLIAFLNFSISYLFVLFLDRLSSL